MTQEASTRHSFALLEKSQSVDNKVSESLFFTLRHRCLSSSAFLSAVGKGEEGLQSQHFTETGQKNKKNLVKGERKCGRATG